MADRTPLVVLDGDVLGQRRTGDETYVRGLLGELPNRSPAFRLCVATRRPDLVPTGVPSVHTGPGGQLRRVLRGLPNALADAGADLLHANYFVPPSWRGRSVVTVHDISFARHRGFMPLHDLIAFRTLVPRSMRRSDRVLTVSEWARTDILDRYGLDPDRVVVTPNGIDDDLSPDGPRASRPPFLLFVGGLQARKDPATAVRALAALREPLELVVVGPDRGEGPRVRRLATELGVAERVHILPYVERADLHALYRGAEALVFPSRYEGFGLPAIEAMACGTPVVAAASTSLPEIVGDAGILVPPGDWEAFAAGIERALADAGRLVASGLVRASRYRWSDTAARTAAVYEEVLAR